MFTLTDLETADRHIAQAEKHVVDQEEIVSSLRLKNADTTLAEGLLAEFNASLKMHRSDRARIAEELGR